LYSSKTIRANHDARTLEIPLSFSGDAEQELRLERNCVAGGEARVPSFAGK
jgi:hypothetical protein